ncbi:unnamed protein product [Strongylus vulgaris]|uniref:Uncharacterized protein n=1 Tax=Strongylus vulgaris TaxID=40348 RepID=A0A3P7L3I5_STRVU|nr:unnamed protein product [Strongylus vulgaris]
MSRTKVAKGKRLLGHMDIDTREWSDGILTMVAREVIKDTSVHTWIVFDGDIDPEWIEALNSVLDDNRLLTMPSGERIQFGSNVNFLFETDSLEFASPATVSRMGMIYISEEDISAKEVVAKWVKTLTEEHPSLPDWIEQHFQRCYEWCLAAGLTNGVGKVAALQNGLSHLRESRSSQHFLVNLFRGLSSVIDSEKKRDFATIVFQGVPLPDMENPELVYFDSRTDSLMRYQDDLGVGVKLEDMKRGTKPFILTASAQSNRDTTSSALGRVLRPKDRPQLILYLKGLNLPAPDKYGTNEMLAFLTQLLTYQGYYDEHLDWIGLENIQITASMAPSVTHSSIPPRLVSQMRMLAIGYPSEQNLNAIYSAYLMPILEVN